MATKFPKFSQDLAQDPTTRRLWYGIATAHDFESHDGMTEENLYQKIFATHFGHLGIIFGLLATCSMSLGKVILNSGLKTH
jgi:photosystem I P700 chlorophyll a apoprotein A2